MYTVYGPLLYGFNVAIKGWLNCNVIAAWAAKLPELLKRQGLLMSVEDLQQPQTGLADVLQNKYVLISYVHQLS